jgi:hypothetical protein
MAQRQRAHRAELTIQRITAMREVSMMLLALVDVARDEAMDPPLPLNPPLPFRATRIPAMLVSLGVALTILDSLDGPEPQAARSLAAQGFHVTDDPMRVLGAGIDALREIDSLVCNDDRLRVAASPS